MKHLFSAVFFFFLVQSAFAQKSYLIHITIEKIYLGSDSVIYPKGKTFLVEAKSHTDTIEVAKPGGVPVAMVVEVRKAKMGEQIKYQIGYSFYKRENSKWILIRKFPFTDRYALNVPTPGLEKSGTKKWAHEEFHCSIGQPEQFEAYFRMDVYKK